MLMFSSKIPFRKSPPLQLSTAVKQYISTKYDQHPDMFTADLAAIDKLRNDAINVQEAHVSGVMKISIYAAQLQWISGKFPIDVCILVRFLRGLRESGELITGNIDWGRFYVVSSPRV